MTGRLECERRNAGSRLERDGGLRVQKYLKPLKGNAISSVLNPKFASFCPRVPNRTSDSKDTGTLKIPVRFGSEIRLKCQPTE